jgi:hypothetical protein
MAEKLGNEQVVTVEELLLSQSYEIAALVSLLEKKGIFTRDEIIAEIKSLRKPVP